MFADQFRRNKLSPSRPAERDPSSPNPRVADALFFLRNKSKHTQFSSVGVAHRCNFLLARPVTTLLLTAESRSLFFQVEFFLDQRRVTPLTKSFGDRWRGGSNKPVHTCWVNGEFCSFLHKKREMLLLSVWYFLGDRKRERKVYRRAIPTNGLWIRITTGREEVTQSASRLSAVRTVLCV